MRAEKQFLLDEIKEKIEKSNGFIVARYQGFGAGKSREFRDSIAEIGGEFEVVKKRVFIKAANALGIEFDDGTFEGHVGVLFAHEDASGLAKKAVKYGEQNADAISVLAGHMDGQLMSAEEVIAVAKLPSLNELRAQIVGLLQAPLSQTVGAMNAVLTSVLHCLEEKSKK